MSVSQPQSPPVPPEWFKGAFGVWILSIVCVIFLPCFPLLVEGYKTNWDIRRESVLLTAAVLAAGYLVSSRTNTPRAMYIVVFLVSVAYDFRPAPLTSPSGVGQLISTVSELSVANMANIGLDWSWTIVGWCGNHFQYVLLIIAIVVHAMERFSWHVVLDSKFPDWVR